MKTLKSATLTSGWGMTNAPNGSCGGTERYLHTVEIYEEEGGSKRARGFWNIESREGSVGPRFGTWEDGWPPAVAQWEAKIDAKS